MHLIRILICVCAVSMSHASPQIGDVLVIDDEKTARVHYFHSGFSENARANLKTWIDKNSEFEVENTGNYDGIYFSLSLVSGKLYVTRVEVDTYSTEHGYTKSEVPLRILYGSDGPIFARWFSRELWEYFGEPLGYTHMSTMAKVYQFKGGYLMAISSRKTRQEESD